MTARSNSLVEQKKLQWNKEREEMKFYGLWGNTSCSNTHRKLSDSYLTQLDKSNRTAYSGDIYNSNDNTGLPPIQKLMYNEYKKCSVENKGYNTSGFDNVVNTKDQFNDERKNQLKSQSGLQSNDITGSVYNNAHADDIISRMKWGDRGVGVGHLWEPTMNFDSRLPEINNRPGTPHWLQRSLVDKTHLPGQGILCDPDVIVQREKKRQKTLDFQEAIRQQLLERERKRKEDREQQLEEEEKLEQKVRKQQEIEQYRIEEEQRKQKVKEEKENMKSQVMWEALAIAEKLAKEAKMKTKGNKAAMLGNLQTNSNQNELLKNLQFCSTLNDGVSELNKKQPTITCDAHTSLTTENYFEEFKSKIPLVTNSCTQTNICLPLKRQKKPLKINHERPKWGVNLPSTKYMKQSEKDLFYRRKYNLQRKCHVHQDPSSSSRSHSSSFGKDFNINMRIKSKFNQYSMEDQSKINNTDYKDDKFDKFHADTKNFTENSSINNDLLLSEQDVVHKLSSLSNELEMKKSYWDDEASKIPSTMFAVLTIE